VILVDSSVWIDHLRRSDPVLTALLQDAQVLAHAFVIGELALGSLRERSPLIAALRGMPQATKASDEEVSIFIERHALFGLGIGWVDAHLLAATQLSNARIWSRDERLSAVAEQLEVAARQQ
jgi:predicted nucleic acid-binding protein